MLSPEKYAANTTSAASTTSATSSATNGLADMSATLHGRAIDYYMQQQQQHQQQYMSHFMGTAAAVQPVTSMNPFASYAASAYTQAAAAGMHQTQLRSAGATPCAYGYGVGAPIVPPIGHDATTASGTKPTAGRLPPKEEVSDSGTGERHTCRSIFSNQTRKTTMTTTVARRARAKSTPKARTDWRRRSRRRTGSRFKCING